MRGFAHALEYCADIIRDSDAATARSAIAEYIERTSYMLQRCDGGNFYLEQQIVAGQSILRGLESFIIKP